MKFSPASNFRLLLIFVTLVLLQCAPFNFCHPGGEYQKDAKFDWTKVSPKEKETKINVDTMAVGMIIST